MQKSWSNVSQLALEHVGSLLKMDVKGLGARFQMQIFNKWHKKHENQAVCDLDTIKYTGGLNTTYSASDVQASGLTKWPTELSLPYKGLCLMQLAV